MTGPNESPEAAAQISQDWLDALGRLSEDDQKLLVLLRFMGNVIDPRYEMKGIRVLIGRALVDPGFRARIIDDADAAVRELRGHVDLPEGVRIHCVENSPEDLTIVLPPLSEAVHERARTISDAIFSRSVNDPALAAAAGVDDNDVLPVNFPPVHFGDRSRDGH